MSCSNCWGWPQPRHRPPRENTPSEPISLDQAGKNLSLPVTDSNKSRFIRSYWTLMTGFNGAVWACKLCALNPSTISQSRQLAVQDVHARNGPNKGQGNDHTRLRAPDEDIARYYQVVIRFHSSRESLEGRNPHHVQVVVITFSECCC